MHRHHRHAVEVSPLRPPGLVAFAKVTFKTEAEVEAFAKRIAKAFRKSQAALAASIERFARENPTKFIRGELDAAGIARIFEEPLTAAFVAGATSIVEKAARAEFSNLGLNASLFRMENPYTQGWLQNHGAEMVTGVTKQTKAGIRVLVSRLIKEGGGTGVVDSVRGNIEDLVGLSARDIRAVFRRGDMLRETGKYGEARVKAEMRTYADRLVTQRASNIARTESIRANTAGTMSAWRDAIDQGLLPATGVKRVWIAAGGEACPNCQDLDGETVEMDEPWVHPALGRVFAPPAHPQCRCAIGLTSAG